MSQFELKGLEELRSKLADLRGENAMKAFKSAAGEGAKVIRLAAAANASAVDDSLTPEMIAANITQRPTPKRYARNGDVRVRVGVLGGAKAPTGNGSIRTSGKKALPGGDTYYWRFLEFGTQTIAAKPFMRPAMADGQGAFDAFAAQLGKKVDRMLKVRGGSKSFKTK